jgi:hypothetical protein
MNGARYSAYREARRTIAAVPFNTAERQILFDAVEGIFLAQDPNGLDFTECEISVSGVLLVACMTGRLDALAADAVRAVVKACGPDPEALFSEAVWASADPAETPATAA